MILIHMHTQGFESEADAFKSLTSEFEDISFEIQLCQGTFSYYIFYFSLGLLKALEISMQSTKYIIKPKSHSLNFDKQKSQLNNVELA